MKKVVRCSVIEDHQLLRECLVEKLGMTGDLVVVGAWGCAGAFLSRPIHAEEDVVLVDLNLPDMPGLKLIPQIVANQPTARVIALTMWDHPRYVNEALQAGAKGYVAKGAPFDELISAIRVVAAGGLYVSKDLARRMTLHGLHHRAEMTVNHLSYREFEVFRLLGQGKSLKECGAELEISDKTVSTYRARIMEKLGLNSQADLLRLALSVDADLAET
ncbi:MAG TPA: response regulator transcription factor [Kiritimatiellia bacterium]|nr:response regulator transcription factor [Kiritimatiellia bacterium]